MKVVMFYHSLVSDWNHGNAHFLRGIAAELLRREHEVVIYEPADGWSRGHLLAEHGPEPLHEFQQCYPRLKSENYDLPSLDIDRALEGADAVLVHEWNHPDLVRRLGEHRVARGNYQLFFHDTHHRGVTAPNDLARYDLSHYGGVLAYGDCLRDLYRANRWAWRAWTWHEAADPTIFYPRTRSRSDGDLVWIGNWGDEERTAELREFLIEPVKTLGLRAKVYGVRYPDSALALLRDAGIEYGGWLPNYRVPEIFSRYKVTIHVPRRAYVEQLPGIPTIRPFEALACGIPLVWSLCGANGNLFQPGRDFLPARNGLEMKKHLRALLADKEMGRDLAAHGLETIRARHTCAHRVDQLLSIMEELDR